MIRDLTGKTEFEKSKAAVARCLVALRSLGQFLPPMTPIVIVMVVPVVVPITMVVRPIRIWPILRPAVTKPEVEHRRRHDDRRRGSVHRRWFHVGFFGRLDVYRRRRSHDYGRSRNTDAKTHAGLRGCYGS